MASPLAILLLGFLLGTRHAFDADHLVAVTSIVSEYRNPLRAIWVGVSWGLGHTATLLLVAVVLLLLKTPMPVRVALFFELAVGVVLVLLGLQIFWKLRRNAVHLHPHQHDGDQHVHFHSHAETSAHAHHRARWNNFTQFMAAGIVPGEHPGETLKTSLRPFFRVKSFAVGTVHGLAGSAALMLLVLGSLESAWTGVWYVLVFGVGSVVSMGLVTVFLTLPFSFSARLPRLARGVQSAAAVFSIAFGVYLAYEAGMAMVA